MSYRRRSLTPSRLPLLCSFALLGALPTLRGASAHSPYLLPNAFDLVDRKHVTVEASFTETFFVPDVVMKADDYHFVAPDGSRHSLAPVYLKDLAVLEVPTTEPGTYRISTGQREGRTAKAALVKGEWVFLEPGKAPPEKARVYDMKSITRADVFVTRGPLGKDALAPTNSGLEFRPLTHPNSIFVGEPAQFEVLFDGRPLADQPISIHAGDERHSGRKIHAQTRTDAAGRFSVRIDAPGIYLAMTRYRLLPVADGEPATSHTCSITFEATD